MTERAGDRPAVRRRGRELELAILRAAADELLAVGFAGFTMERVAARAGTNKNAVYRRWSGRAALGVAAYREFLGTAPEPPDTGTLRGDVLEQLRRVNRAMSSPHGEILSGLLLAAAGDPQVGADFQRQVTETGDRAWRLLLDRAVDRGEAPAAAAHPMVAAVPMSLLRNEFLVSGHRAVPEETLTAIVDEVYLPLVRGRGD